MVRGNNVITNVDSVLIHLGTNDIKHCKKNVVVKSALYALDCVHEKWPTAEIWSSIIIPRMGKSIPVKYFNSDAKFINNAILMLCISTKCFRYIDNDQRFNERGNIARSLYDTSDPPGIHVNDDGAVKLYSN